MGGACSKNVSILQNIPEEAGCVRSGRSIDRAGIDRIVRDVAQRAARSSEAWRNKTNGGTTVTSHSLRSAFMNRVDAGDKTSAKIFPGEAPFHPYDRYQEHYSADEPDVAITYTWAMDLLEQLPRFLELIEVELEPVLGRKPRFWLDILFNDQNAADMGGQLAAAELVYQGARFHYALMLFDPFSRGWCLYELLVRILAGMAALGPGARAAELVPLILRRDARFTRLVVVEGLTDVHDDVTGAFYDRFGEMTTFKPGDMADIKRSIVDKVGSAAAFNLLVSSYRHAAIQNTRQGQYDRLWDSADCGDVDAVRRMLADGADVEQRPYTHDRTPLITAAMWGFEAVLRELLAAGADVNAADKVSRGWREWG